MLRPELYSKTVDILVAAYFNDQLEHNLCQRCAVGNLCSAAGFEINELPGFKHHENAVWGLVFHTTEKSSGVFYQKVEMDAYYNNEKGCADVIKGTGYTLEQLMKIEWAFETAQKGNNKDEWMFNGLMAVVECLDKIHQNNDTQVTTNSKNKFTKNLQTV